MSTLVHRADAAVIGTVRAVTTSRLGPESDHPFVSEYRTAVVDVEEALWSSETLPARAAEPVMVQMLGNGRHEGDEYECGGGNTRWNDMAGPMTKGRRVLLLLDVYQLFDGMEETRADGLGNFIVGWSDGNWTIEGDRAVSIVPERSAPLEPLVARLREARNAPPDLGSRRGAVDPLEATEPPPVPTGPPEQLEGQPGPPSDTPPRPTG